MSSIRTYPKTVYIKHTVLGVPAGKTSDEIERNMEYYKWTIYLDGEDNVLKAIEKVVYAPNDPSFYGKKIIRTNWQNKFEYSVFGYGSIYIIYSIYIINRSTLPISGEYYLDISTSNNKGEPITIDY